MVTESQQPESLQQIATLEDSSRYRKNIYEETEIRQMPSFTKSLHNVDTSEGNNVHLECRLQPVGDPNMKVEWFVNGQAIKTGEFFTFSSYLYINNTRTEFKMQRRLFSNLHKQNGLIPRLVKSDPH